MSIQALGRWASAICLVVVVSGCSGTSNRLLSECTWNRSSCMHEGSYEPGEEAYAEEEARRLNKQQTRRIGR
ncbi:hypothetical protein CEK29_07645 [Bordetella genomosp. 5]|uniref:Uncharacterized protein n=1 Tax=Bordetella genomosp. 5 TaxID=1395608 RepID=A0A261TWE6_9BORD|nr:hypothetical protein [Bordetella genomosp. 5]OZI44583.1 hypothetical protein CEK29_07645 [Bordetella genomosp. 5]OZI53482.1 hypothetical protein CAL25_05735 [Bordetella genomosp. 5]